MIARTLLSSLPLLLALGVAAPAAAQDLCATTDDARVVQNYYANIRPGGPPPAAARLYRMPEATLVSALDPDHAYGVRSNRLLFDEVWKSIDSWGKDTKIGLVFTSGGMHAWNFPSTVPQTQGSSSPIWHDMYADDGAGVHGHITPQEVEQIWALQLPTKDADKFTRIIGFYGSDGHLIVGLYVSENTKPFDPAALEGFERTRALLMTHPRACSLG
jgi:putative heme iron utilization protein